MIDCRAIFRPPGSMTYLADSENRFLWYEALIKVWFYSRGWSKVAKSCYYQLYGWMQLNTNSIQAGGEKKKKEREKNFPSIAKWC